jgi:cytochrome c peroxidase
LRQTGEIDRSAFRLTSQRGFHHMATTRRTACARRTTGERRPFHADLARAALLLVGLAAAPALAETPEEMQGVIKLFNDAEANFRPLPVIPPIKDMPNGAARLELGRRLFFETRASADGTVSCGHCHRAELGGADGLAKSIGIGGKESPHNAPSVFNAALNIKQHWRGDRESLEDQAEKALKGPASFGNPDLETPMKKLAAIPAYAEAFKKAFPFDAEPVNAKNWGAAIRDFENTLLTPSRFDRYLSGDFHSLSPQEQTGLRKFIDLGCATCHNGAGLGGKTFEKFGVHGDYWKETGSAKPDRGRAELTGDDADLYVFKVPVLRNVAKTAPYFHDGSVADLAKAVKIMGKLQLNKDVSDADAADIVAFLGALTGDAPANYSAPEPYPDAAQ